MDLVILLHSFHELFLIYLWLFHTIIDWLRMKQITPKVVEGLRIFHSIFHKAFLLYQVGIAVIPSQYKL